MRNARCDFVSLSATQWYPIWLGYCGAYLESRGHEVILIDSPAYYLTHRETYEMVKNFNPDLLLIYTGLQSEGNDVEFGDKAVEDIGCDAVFVGPYASIDPAKTLSKSKFINKLVRGEFEYPVGEIADSKSCAEIENLWYRDKNSGEIISNSPRPYLTTEQMDSIPFVTKFFKEHLDIRKYKAISEYYPFIDVMTGRGCFWGVCSMCLWVHSYIKGPTYNTRSISNVVDEFKYVKTQIPEVRSIMLQDDTLPEDRAVELSEAILENNVRIPWSCYVRGNMSFNALRLMKRAGCRNLHVGYESSSDVILKKIAKGVSKDEMTRFTLEAKRAGLQIHGDFLIGLPGETLKTAYETIRWAKKLNPSTAQFQLAIPYPNTPLYGLLQEKGWLTESGEPNYPDFSNNEMRRVAKRALRAFYISPQYLLKCLRNPYEHFWGRLRTIRRAIPALFWQRWAVERKPEKAGKDHQNSAT